MVPSVNSEPSLDKPLMISKPTNGLFFLSSVHFTQLLFSGFCNNCTILP